MQEPPWISSLTSEVILLTLSVSGRGIIAELDSHRQFILTSFYPGKNNNLVESEIFITFQMRWKQWCFQQPPHSRMHWKLIVSLWGNLIPSDCGIMDSVLFCSYFGCVNPPLDWVTPSFGLRCACVCVFVSASVSVCVQHINGWA